MMQVGIKDGRIAIISNDDPNLDRFKRFRDNLKALGVEFDWVGQPDILKDQHVHVHTHAHGEEHGHDHGV